MLKKTLKIIAIVVGTLTLILFSAYTYIYFQYKKANNTEGKPYKKYIGYINQDKALLNDRYTLCGKGYIQRTYNGSALEGYAVNKKHFREAAVKFFNKNSFDDSGYLNFRFLVNCKGEAGWFEIIEMNLDFKEQAFHPDLVQQLFKFTSNPKHWNILKYKQNNEAYNYYNYISYRIEDGKITEIIPRLCIILICLMSCKNESNLTKRSLSESIYKDAIQFTQGSTGFQNGIAEAVKIDSTYQEAVYELSVADLKRGLPHKWLPQYNKAVQLNPELRIPWRGYLYLWFYRDYKKAIADFDASDQLTPYIDNPQGHSVDYWRGIAYLGLKDYKKSQNYFKKDIEQQSKQFSEDYIDSTTFLYYGIALMETKDYEIALLNFNKVLQYSNQMSSDAKYYKALIFVAQGELVKAKTEIKNALIDFNNGYYNQRAYAETLRQLYVQDFERLEQSLN